MRKLFLFMRVSLDGFIKKRNGDIGLHPTNDEFKPLAMQQATNTGKQHIKPVPMRTTKSDSFSSSTTTPTT